MVTVIVYIRSTTFRRSVAYGISLVEKKKKTVIIAHLYNITLQYIDIYVSHKNGIRLYKIICVS